VNDWPPTLALTPCFEFPSIYSDTWALFTPLPPHHFHNNLEVVRGGKNQKPANHTLRHFNEMHTRYLTQTPTSPAISSSYQFISLTENRCQLCRWKVISQQMFPERSLALLDSLIITFVLSSGGELYICQVEWWKTSRAFNFVLVLTSERKRKQRASCVGCMPSTTKGILQDPGFPPCSPPTSFRSENSVWVEAITL
jgi:hypothetical protein